MLFRVYLEKEPFMENIRLIKATPEGVALKDNMGVSRIVDGVYVAEVESVAGYVTLRHAQRAGPGS